MPHTHIALLQAVEPSSLNYRRSANFNNTYTLRFTVPNTAAKNVLERQPCGTGFLHRREVSLATH